MSYNNLTAETAGIRKFLRGKKSCVHMPGICGVGMAGLAFLLKRMGHDVTGCDKSPSHLAGWLRKNGIPVLLGHDPRHISGADWIVRSAAVPENIPEIRAARKAGVKIFRRGLVLAALAAESDSICVSGTHGKTTTTAMIAQILTAAGLDPSFAIGGEVASLGGVAGYGKGGMLVAEADESDGTLAFYEPSIAVVTNIEFDHAEHFKNMGEVQECFVRMAKGTRRRIVYCCDDAAAAKLFRKLPRAFSYGFSPGADLRLSGQSDSAKGVSFRLALNGKSLGRLTLPVPGAHNALNAAAAGAVGLECGVPFSVVARALACFQPVARRFEKKVDSKNLLVISDYAHHPSEIAALLKSARFLRRPRWLAVFQPHRYSRTRALGPMFPPAFMGVDELILCPVYAASEKIISGGTSWDLYERFRQNGKVEVVCANSPDQAWDYLKTKAASGDGILVIGAGDVVRIAARAKKEVGKGSRSLNPATRWYAALKKLKLRCSVVRFCEPMAEKTTLRVGGRADIFVEAGDEADLACVVKWAFDHCVPVRTIGLGSNILVSDLGVRGIVLRLKGEAWRAIRTGRLGEVLVGAGASLNELVEWTARQGRGGAEFLTGIPGTVGGAVRMNAGAWGDEMAGVVGRIRAMEKDGRIVSLDRRRLGLSYRCCEALKERIVLDVVLNLREEDEVSIRGRITEVRKRRKWMAGMRSAGSVFMNPEGDKAGRLIEGLGLKGRKIGGARVSEKHANIIVNAKGARASDVMALIGIVRDQVKIKCGVDLKREIEYFE